MRRILAAGLFVALGFGCATLQSVGASSVVGRHAATGPRRSTSEFVYATESRHGITTRIELRSARNGALLETLAILGSRFTNNGMSLPPDRDAVYLTLIGHHALLIDRLGIVTRKQRDIADGEEPAVSPNGRMLAFLSGRFGSESLVMRDLATRRTTTLDLRPVLGASRRIAQGPFAWTGDSSQIALLTVSAREPGHVGSAAVAKSYRLDPASRSVASLIVVHVSPRGKLLARRVPLVVHIGVVDAVFQDGTARDSIILTTALARGSALYRIRLSATKTKVSDRVPLPTNTLPEAISPTGREMLYLRTSQSPGLFKARIAPNRLGAAHLLLAHTRFVSVAW
jgi:hypothetical protein